jgi:pyrroloquinoline-quinone synthase
VSGADDGVLSPDELEARLRAIGEQRYHDRHPFNLRMHEGTLTRAEIQTWARNRYYYQTRIPLKDSLIVAKASDPSFRREWLQRIRDHDGARQGEGGLALWLQLASAVGLDPASVERLEGILPGVRRACDAYVELVETSDLLTSVAASLTELFAGNIMHTRIEAFEKHYPWVDTSGLAYFRTRTTQAPRDAAWGLDFVRRHATTLESQQRCLSALERKCSILWSLLDAVERACRRPRRVSHAALRFDEAEDAWLVVLPERALKLGGSGRRILELCDGSRTGLELMAELGALAGASDQTDEEVDDFLRALEQAGAVRFEPAGPDGESPHPGAEA